MRHAVTNHAVNQYMRRIRPDLAFAAARAEIEAAVPTAEKTTRPAYGGAAYWRIDSLNVAVVAIHDAETMLVLTVVPQRDHVQTHAERLFAAEELKRASEAADAGRLAEARCKVVAEAAQEKRPMPAPRTVQQKALNESKLATDRRVTLELECNMLRAEIKLSVQQEWEQHNREQLTEALRIAVRTIATLQSPGAALAEIAAISPGLVTEKFYEKRDRK